MAEQAALAQLGQLAAVVAHEVRNPLAGLRGTLEVLQPRVSASPKDRDVIKVMIERIDILNAKVNDILRFARPQMPVLQPLNVTNIIEDAVESACASIGRDRPSVTFTGDSAFIFDAFYTTKTAGTGLGLPIVKRVMELQDGTVPVEAARWRRNRGGSHASAGGPRRDTERGYGAGVLIERRFAITIFIISTHRTTGERHQGELFRARVKSVV